MTVSGGIACAQQHPQALLKLLGLAVNRLYLAKRQRNCVVADGSGLPARAGLADPPAPARAGHELHA